MEENKNSFEETSDSKAENEQIGENQTGFSEELVHALEQPKTDMGDVLGLEDQMREELDNLVATTNILAKEQNGAGQNTGAPVLDFGTSNIPQELHHAEEMARQEYTPLSGQNPVGTFPQQPPAQMGANGYNVERNQPLQPNQYSQPIAPNVPPQQAQQYNQQQTGYTPVTPQQNYYNQPVVPVDNANQQYGQPYQGAPEYQDHSVFYQNQTSQQQGQQAGQQQGQYSNQHNQQQYTQQSEQPQQNYQAPGQGYYQNNQYYPNLQTQKPATDGLAIASVVLGAISVIGNFAMEIIGFSIVAGIVGLILGIVSRNKNKSSMSLIGIILNAVGLAITVVFLIACVACIRSLMSYGYDGGFIDPWSYF